MSGVNKPSGIKPPSSKLTKPSTASVNGKETEDGSASRRTSEDMGVRRLPERKISVNEHEKDESDTVGDLPKQHDRKMSEASRKMSDGSVDAAWEQARRLSEAGVRRMSDASVLTLDTDSFIVGDRVYVNGVKPGSIQYIGEAKFAPGEWAGIVLDDSSGKNDGSVGGVRYFQCQPKRGIFSRLTRLTRVPLEGADVASSEAISEAPTTSPTPSKVGVPSSKASSPAPSLPPPSDLKIGQRVIVNSSLGSKAGVLRFVGLTDFAAGNWAGVELDDAVGKNDGTVGGKRYFECRPNYGLFAPVHKVSLSPANAMRKLSTVATPSRPGLTRERTRDSMGSVSVSSMASTASRVRLGVQSLTSPNKRPSRPSPPAGPTSALQDLLREKDKQIEQLLKEREFERAAFVRAAAQTEEAEKRIYESNKKLSQLEDEANGEMQRLQLLLSKNEEERKITATQWEEDRRKLEDLQFQLEELEIIKSESEGRTAELETRRRKLETLLKEEQAKNEELEKEANRGFELEEQLVTLKEEKEALLGEIKRFKEGLTTADNELEKELIAAKEKIIALEESLTEKDHEVKAEKEEKQKWHKVVQQTEAANDELNKQVIEMTELLKIKDHELQDKEKEIELGKLELKHVQGTAGQEERQLDELSASIVKQEKEIHELNQTIQTLNTDKLNILRQCETLESQVRHLTHERDEAQRKIELKEQEVCLLKQNLTDLHKAVEGNSEEQVKTVEMLHKSQEMERELTLVKQQLEDFRKIANVEKVDAELALKEKAQEITTLQEKLKNAESDLARNADLHRQMEAALDDAEKLRQALKALEYRYATDLKGSEARIEDLNRVLKEREAQAVEKLKISEAKTQELEHVCDVSEFNLQELQDKYETLRTESQKVSEAKDVNEKEITRLQDELRHVQTQLGELRTEYDALKQDLSVKTNIASQETAEQRGHVARLEQELTGLRTTHADLEATLRSVQNQRETLENERAKFNEAVKDRDAKLVQVTLEVERLKTTFDAHRSELQQELERTLKEAEMAEELRIALEKTRARGEELEALVQAREAELEELQEQKRAFVEELERLTQYEAERESFKHQLAKKEDEIATWSRKSSELQTELSSFAVRYDKDKRVWEQKVVDMQVKQQIYVHEDQSDPQMSRLLEEKESSKREIAFLNSVIVDMQRKLDEHKVQLEISHASLMNQGIADVSNKKNGHVAPQRVVAPRLFCDICDKFDVHDTEDCPTQSSFDAGYEEVNSREHSQHKGKRNEQRPYCDTCEVFGHSTNECAEEDTY